MKVVSTICLAVLFTSCYSYKVFPVEDRNFVYTGKKQIAYVRNTELLKEYEILKHAGIFELTDDSTRAELTLQLSPVKTRYGCSQGAVVTMATLGQLPVYFADFYGFEFAELKGTDTVRHQFQLTVAKRFWFWDMFCFKKQFSEKAGRALASSYAKATNK